MQESILRTQEEVNQTQQAIQALIDSTKSAGSSSVLRLSSGQERDRQVFGPRDDKIDVLPSQLQLGIWKKWRHEVEIYIDTIGPSWRGVKLLLQQARHSPTPLDPSRIAMSGVGERARKANAGVDPIDEMWLDYPGNTSTSTGCSCPSSTLTRPLSSGTRLRTMALSFGCA